MKDDSSDRKPDEDEMVVYKFLIYFK